MSASIGLRLEKYSSKHPEEVLMVNIQNAAGESDKILVYNGFSSSLMNSTTYDPDIPIIAEDDRVVSIDRLASPYDPINPTYLQTDLTWEEMDNILLSQGF
jgi:hypothetical protein